jgi:hypothetical protein
MNNPFTFGRGKGPDEFTEIMNAETVGALSPEDRAALDVLQKANELLNRELPPGYTYLIGISTIEQNGERFRLDRTIHTSCATLDAVPYFLGVLHKSAVALAERWAAALKPRGDA